MPRPEPSAAILKQVARVQWVAEQCAALPLHASPEREAMVPTYLRRAARQYAPAQWYEEDCDVCVVAVTFPEDFAGEPEFLNHARAYVSVDPRYQPGA